MSRRSKKGDPNRSTGWRRRWMASVRDIEPALMRPRARWRGMLAASFRGPPIPYGYWLEKYGAEPVIDWAEHAEKYPEQFKP